MRRTINRFLCWILRLVLRFRYRVDVKGLDIVRNLAKSGKGVLILPNHPAEIDPFIILSILIPYFDVHPLVVEKFFYYKGASFFMRLLRAKPVAEFDKAVTDYKRHEAEKLYYDVVDELKRGGHILLYPGSGLKRGAEERLGGRSLAYRTLQDAEEAEMLLVRISGLWGSMFSVAQTGDSPDFWQSIVRGLSILLKNGLFFAPKRRVLVEFGAANAEIPRSGSRWEFNQALEKWYNQYPDKSGERVEKEPIKLVRYYFWSKKEPHPYYETVRKRRHHDLFIPNNVRQDIIYQLSLLSGKAVNEIHDEDDLLQDLRLDSLNIASLYSHIDDTYGIAGETQPGDFKTVEDLFAAATHVHHQEGQQRESTKEDGSSWPKEKQRARIFLESGQSLIEAFLKSTTRLDKSAACSDLAAGVMTYAEMKRAVVILANKIRNMEGDYIGVLLPSSAGAYIIFFAIMLAKKVPVPLNWTVGPYFTDYAIDLMKIKHVLTARKFIDRLDNVDLGAMIEKFVFIEDVRKSLTLQDKVSGAFLAKRKPAAILKYFGADQLNPDDTAVVLFTSGTTALPKAVPLTHKSCIKRIG